MHALRVECHSTHGLIKPKNPLKSVQDSVSTSFCRSSFLFNKIQHSIEIIKHSRISAMITEFCGSFLWMNFCKLLLSRESEIELIFSAFFKKRNESDECKWNELLLCSGGLFVLKPLNTFPIDFHVRFALIMCVFCFYDCLFPWESFNMSKIFWCQCHQPIALILGIIVK